MKCTKCDRETCDKCQAGINDPHDRREIPPPFGSLNAMYPVVVCKICYREYAKLGWTWLGLPLPPDGVMHL